MKKTNSDDWPDLTLPEWDTTLPDWKPIEFGDWPDVTLPEWQPIDLGDWHIPDLDNWPAEKDS